MCVHTDANSHRRRKHTHCACRGVACWASTRARGLATLGWAGRHWQDWCKVIEWIHWCNNESVVCRHYFRGKRKITLYCESGLTVSTRPAELPCWVYPKSSAAQWTAHMKDHLLWSIIYKMSIYFTLVPGSQPFSHSLLFLRLMSCLRDNKRPPFTPKCSR